MKKTLVLMSVGAAFLLKAQDVSTLQNTVDIYSNTQKIGSAKFNSMAGSNGALGGDATSLLTNPAGLGVAISGDASVTLGITSNKNTSTINGASFDYNINKADISNASGIISIPLMTETPWKFVNIGVNFSNRSIENYVETPGNTNVIIQKDLVDPLGNPLVGNLTYMGHAYDRTGYQSVLNFGVGANYNNTLYFGAGLNFHNSDVTNFDTAAFLLDADNSINNFSKQYTPFQEQSNGFSASLGVIGKVNNQLRLGLALETPTWWQLDRVYSEYYEQTDGIYYSDFQEERNLRTPMRATISGAFVPNKNFSLNVDYTLGLTKPKYSVDGPAETELNNYFTDNYKNTSEVRIGAEYRIKAFRLRGGYAFTSSPFDSTNISAFTNSGSVANTSYDNLILGSRNTIGIGVGYNFSSFFIDASYQNVNSKYNNPFLTGYVTPNPDYAYFSTGYHSGDYDVTSDNALVSEVKNNKNNFFLTFGWKF